MKCSIDNEFFDNGMLKPEAREVLLRVVDDIVNELKENDFDLKFDKVVLTGSITSPNFSSTSDIDLHFLIDYNEYSEDAANFVRLFLEFFKRDFNNREYDILNHPLEIYFQDVDEIHHAPGIYDIQNNEWIKTPECETIEYSNAEKQKAKEIYDEILELKSKWDSQLVEDKEEFLNELTNFLLDLKKYRQTGLDSNDELNSTENLVFKLLRKNGALRTLVELKHDVLNSIYDIDKD